jgi:ribonuclease Z
MRPRFHPRLANDPFGDPCLFIPFGFENRALMMDLGEAPGLSPRDLLRTSHVFVTHTHMDHFAGFDRLLRLGLGRRKEIHLFGPRGFLANVRGKLEAYTWNLVERFDQSLVLAVTEVLANETITARLDCRFGFRPTSPPQRRPFTGVLLEEPSLAVRADLLDHGTPCLGFAVAERFHINILKNALEDLGLPTGPWLQTFKQALYRADSPTTPIQIPAADGRGAPRAMTLGFLTPRIARITPGQKIAYIADVACSRDNIARITTLAAEADHLFIEAAFRDGEAPLGQQKHHLTASQAGWIARRTGARRLSVFHFSPRYHDCPEELEREALAAFQSPSEYLPPELCPNF